MLQGTQYIATTVAASGRGVIDWLSALSTVAVAIFAGVEIWRGKRLREAEERRVKQEQEDRRVEADARVSALAYAVRRQARSWLALDSAPQVVQWKAEIASGFVRLEDRLHKALEEVHASVPVRASLRLALLHYYRAMDTFEQLPPTPEGMTLDKAALMWHGLSNLRAEVNECAESLTGAIDPALEAADHSMR